MSVRTSQHESAAMRVLVVDDEPLARAALEKLLTQRSDIEKFELVDDAHQALAALRAHPYDVLLLDIHMPNLTGLQLIEQLSKQNGPMPSVVFITAHQEHAVEAFEKRAVDYVLKPFDPKRVHEALDVAVRRSAQERAARLLDMLGELKLRPERTMRIAIKDKGRVVFVESGELISAEAHGNYVLLRQKSGSHLLRETMSGIAEKLRPYGFIRIHRSVLVNIEFVDTIQPGVGSEYLLRTKTGKQYRVTRTYRSNLRELAQFWIGTESFDPD
jgi:two-component system LytT family response regulator